MKKLAALMFPVVVLSAQVRVFDRLDSLTILPDGLEARSGQASLRVTALREDVVRVRFGREGRMPEDASWAVLPAARTASLRVTAAGDGFATARLRVRILPDLRVVISDLTGKVLLADAPGRPLEFHGESFRVYKQMPPDEHYFGLGDKTGPLDRRGWAYSLWNTDTGFSEGTDPIYKSIPFFIGFRAGHAYGVLFDNTFRSSFDFGKEERDAYSFGSEGGPLDYYFWYGPSPKEVVRTYAWLTGTAPLPPMWSLGFQQSRYSYDTEAKVRQVAARLRADRIPVDALYFDIDYQKKNRPFTVDEKAFPDFGKLLKDLNHLNFHPVLITDLHIANLPNSDYAPYDEGIRGGHFVKNSDGSVYSGIVWPGPAVFPDFTRSASRAWWGSLYKDFYTMGAAGFWNDMNEPAVFQTATKTIPLDVFGRLEEPGFEPRNITQREAHNIFGMLNTRGTFEGLLKLNPDLRPFVLTRATYAGGHRYAATWTGDNASTWNHLRMSTPMLLNLGLSGFSIAGDDIGGFGGSPSMDLLTKWFEIGAFNPIYRDHTEKVSLPQEPWVGGPRHEGIRKRYIEERYRLLPYVYTVAEEASRTGIPMMRPLFLEFPEAAEDKHPLDLDAGNQFLWGPALMVAPAVFSEEPQKYAVKLPAGDWYDYWSGRKTAGRAPGGDPVITGERRGPAPVLEVEITPTLEELPVYVRGGSIIPRQPLVQSTGEKPLGALELRVYPGPNCGGSVYQDDGISFAYKQGAFLRQEFTCEAGADAVTVRLAPRQGSFAPWWKEIEIAVYGWTGGGAKAAYNGKPVASPVLDAAHGVVRVRIPEQPAGGELRVSVR